MSRSCLSKYMSDHDVRKYCSVCTACTVALYSVQEYMAFFANNMIPIGSHKKVLNEYIMYVQYIVCTFTK